MSEIEIKKFTPADRDWMIASHVDLYQREDGFDDSFGPFIAVILDDFQASGADTGQCGWIAWSEGRRVGSVFVTRLDAQTAQLRLFQIAPQLRGQGLGYRLLNICTGFARDAGYRRMKLWTHESHRAACALYARGGWQIIEQRAVFEFGQPLTEQVMQLDLTG